MSASSSSSRRGPAVAARRGLTIVEVIVAIMVLSIGLLSLASTSAYVVRQMRGGVTQTVAAQLAQSRFDSLASVRCTDLAPAATTTGKSTFRGVTESWAVVDSVNVKLLSDTITYKGRKKPLVYKSVIPCRDV